MNERAAPNSAAEGSRPSASRQARLTCASAFDPASVATFCGIERGVLEISRTGHDEPVQWFQFPTSLHKLTRQPFEQFRMRRRLAANAEIIHRADEALSKMMLPHAVHNNSRNEGTGSVV